MLPVLRVWAGSDPDPEDQLEAGPVLPRPAADEHRSGHLLARRALSTTPPPGQLRALERCSKRCTEALGLAGLTILGSYLHSVFRCRRLRQHQERTLGYPQC
jgi:hypothetical protein